MLRCVDRLARAGARAAVAALANATREQTFAAGQGLPGRVWAFRRPVWVAELSGEALRAGLVSGAAFPIALGDECVGVIELYASDAREPNAEVSAMFATVGGQLASYLARRRKRARARRAFDGAEALVVALDADGRVEIANGTACAALGVGEDELLGRDWFEVVDRPDARAAFLAGEGVDAPETPGVTWRWSLSRDADGEPIGALGWGEPRSRRRSALRLEACASAALLLIAAALLVAALRLATSRTRPPPRRRRAREARRSPSTTTARAAHRRASCKLTARRRPTARRAAPPPACPRATSRRRRADTACTQIFGGPETATIKGTIRGEPVDAKFSRSDGCEIERWKRVEPLLAEVR